MDKKDAQLRKEECRALTRAYLAAREALSFRAGAIQRGLVREDSASFSEEEIAAAAEFWEGLGQVEAEAVSYGATKNYKITSAGVLAVERGE